MSILIKGMEMPKARDTLVLAKTDGTAIVYEDEAYVTTAVPVPQHGRLIDADALIKTNNPIGKMMVFGGQYVYTEDEIQNAPTILEAEEGK